MVQKIFDHIDELKKKIDSRLPLPAASVQQLKEYFRIGLTYTSNALEGNSLTEVETKIILEDGLTAGGKSLRDHLEVLGHSQAYDLMWQLAGKKKFSESDILALHHLFFHRVDEKAAGSYRTVPVIVTGVQYQFPLPPDIPKLMQQFITSLETLLPNSHPVEYAALAHLNFVLIHPFIDGNGRTARLLLNLVLLQQGYVVTIIPPVTRREYLESLRSANNGDNEPFIRFIAERVLESHKEYVRLLTNNL